MSRDHEDVRMNDEHRADAQSLPDRIETLREAIKSWIAANRGVDGVPPHLGPIDYDLDDILDDLVSDACDRERSLQVPLAILSDLRLLDALEQQVSDYALSLMEELRDWFVAHGGRQDISEYDVEPELEKLAELPPEIESDLDILRSLREICDARNERQVRSGEVFARDPDLSHEREAVSRWASRRDRG